MSSSARRIYGMLFDADLPEGPLGLREKGKIAKVAKVLKAARTLFSAMDYEAVRMDEIAAKAEISKATLYSYFETKEMVLIALFAQTQERIDAGRESLLESADLSSPVETCARYEALLNEMGLAELPVSLWRVVYAARVTDRALKPGALLAGVASTIMDDRHRLLSRMVEAGTLRRDMDVASMARVLHAIGRMHWETFISDPAPDLARTNDLNATDIACALSPYLQG